MRTLGRGLLLAALAGCGPGDGSGEPVEVVWLEGAGFGWDHFNHRLSHLRMQLDDDGARVALIGGTSTSGAQTELDEACDPDRCDEFPFRDEAHVRLDWARAEADVAVAVGAAELVVGADGGSASVELTLDDPREATVAVIRGLLIDTDEPVEGEPNCYQPKNGWLPRRIQVALGEPEVRGTTVTVPVHAAFEAGHTLEEARACIDEVASRARVRVAVDVLVVSAQAPARAHEVAQSATFPFGGGTFEPDPQEPPAPEALSVADDALVGWSALDWSFHVDDPDLRGAYLRTLDLRAAPGEVSASATNHSPGTQLSGFDYAFVGTVRELPLGAPVRRGALADDLDAELDDGGEPVVHALPLE